MIKNIFRIIKISVLAFLLISNLSVLIFKFINPPTSAFIQSSLSDLLLDLKPFTSIERNWFSYNNIKDDMKVAVIASEDQKFSSHFGFDFDQIEKAYKDIKRGRRFRGASTITQQTAKNLFLWKGQTFIRKGFEAYFTLLLEIYWSKERILEVYLNIAQFGENIYGVGTASRIYYKKEPAKLKRGEAAMLAAVLPNPVRYRAAKPTYFLLGRRDRIMRQMGYIGGKEYLKNL